MSDKDWTDTIDEAQSQSATESARQALDGLRDALGMHPVTASLLDAAMIVVGAIAYYYVDGFTATAAGGVFVAVGLLGFVARLVGVLK